MRRGNPNGIHGEVGDCRTKNVRNDKLERGFDVVTLVMHISINNGLFLFYLLTFLIFDNIIV